MNITEAFNIISDMIPCGNCKYKNSGCNRLEAHVWNDGFCLDFDEAVFAIRSALFPTEPEPDPEPNPEG